MLPASREPTSYASPFTDSSHARKYRGPPVVRPAVLGWRVWPVAGTPRQRASGGAHIGLRVRRLVPQPRDCALDTGQAIGRAGGCRHERLCPRHPRGCYENDGEPRLTAQRALVGYGRPLQRGVRRRDCKRGFTQPFQAPIARPAPTCHQTGESAPARRKSASPATPWCEQLQ